MTRQKSATGREHQFAFAEAGSLHSGGSRCVRPLAAAERSLPQAMANGPSGGISASAVPHSLS
jgi:hypothetical protein